MIRLLSLFSLSYLRHRPLKIFLTLLGMSVGIAVYVAIDLSNRSVLVSLRRTMEETKGQSDVSVTGSDGPLKDEDFSSLLKVPGTRAVTPVLELSGHCPGRPERTLTFLGIDPLTRGAFFTGGGDARLGARFLSLMEGRNRALVPPEVAAACGSGDGKELTLVAGGNSFTMEAAVPPASGAWWESSSLVFLDLATAQETFGRIGALSRLEVLLDGTPREAWETSARRTLGSHLRFTGKEEGFERGRRILKAFQINLLALGLVSIFVAVFIVYNSSSLALLQRRGDFGTLRSLGLSRGRLVRLFLIETAVFGALSGAMGLLLGRGLAAIIFSRIARTVDSLYRLDAGSDVGLAPATIAIAFAIGLFASLAGALTPLAEAASIAPVEATRRLGYESRIARRSWIFPIAALFCFAAWIALARLGAVHRPEWSFLASLACLLGFLLLAPLTLAAVVRCILPLARRFRRGALLVACGQFLENPYRYGVVTAALSLGVALWLGVGLMVHSFRESVRDWVKASIRGDVYMILSEQDGTFLPASFLEKTKGLSGVAHLDTLRLAPVRLPGSGEDIQLSAIALKGLFQRGIFRILNGDRGAFSAPANEGVPVVAVAESFARRAGVAAGDTLAVESNWGTWTLTIGAVLYDYSSERGLIYMDADDFTRLTGDRRVNGVALFLEDPSDAAATAAGINLWTDLPPALRVEQGAAVRARVLRIFDETFQVTEGLKFVAIFVAFLGIISTLSIVFEQKRWELGLLAALGLSPAGLQGYGLSQGLLLSLAGFVLGGAAGLALCANIIHLIHKNFFGWTIFFDFDPWAVAACFALTLLTGALAALFLIRRFSRLKPAEALRYGE